MTDQNAQLNAAAAGTFDLGGDLSVNRMGFGAMRITGEGIWGEPENPEEARRVLRRTLERGINFIDTADSYGPKVSERLIAETLHPYPDGLVIATKGGFTRPGPGRWEPDGRPEHLREACEGSLRRLKVDRIDLYQLHRIDPRVPPEEQVGTLAELREEGKIRHVGLSEVGSEDVLHFCEREGMGFIPWFPLATGNLARPGGPLDEIAARYNVTPGQIALAWLLWRSPVMLPIPGTSSVKHLEENVAAASLELDGAEFEELAESAP